MKRSIPASGSLLIAAGILFGSIYCKAQTSSITGIVYEKDQASTAFQTPYGKLTVYLPDDIRNGDMITGTVSAEPLGKDPKEKKKNLAELIKYRLCLPEGTPDKSNVSIPANGTSVFSAMIACPAGKPCIIELRSPEGKPVSRAEIPTGPSLLAGFSKTPAYAIAKKVIANTEPLVLLMNSSTGAPPEVTLHNFYSKPAVSQTLQPIAVSPRKVVYRISGEISGMFKVCIRPPGGPARTIDLVNIVDVQASIGKGDLMKDESTELSIDILGLEGCPYRPVQLEIRNETPAVIRLAQGNRQLFPVDHSDNALSFLTRQPFNTAQSVIGLSSGNFAIRTELHIPPSAYANTAQPYLQNAETPQAFNSGINALKNDILQYLDHPNADPPTKNYLQSVLEQFTPAMNASQLGQVKAMAVNLLNPLIAFPRYKSFLDQLNALNTLNPELAKQAGTQQLVHPLHDLAGEFNSQTNILTVNDASKELLLQYLNAQPQANGTYTFTIYDGDKPDVFTDVQVKPTDIDINDPGNCDYGSTPLPGPKPVPVNPEKPVKKEDPKYPEGHETPGKSQPDGLGAKAETTDGPKPQAGDADETPKAGTKASTGSDTTKTTTSIEWPELTKAFTDSTGRRYKFYKNAECHLLYKLSEISYCKAEEKGEISKETGKTEYKPTGRYEKWVFQPKKMCIKGEGFCTEMWQVSSVQMIYEDKNCETLVEVIKWEDFLCK